MKIAYTNYELQASHSLNALAKDLKRQGALLRVTFAPDLIGYADCHPWTELGDVPLKEQLECLRHQQFTPLTRGAVALAQIDAQARSQGQSLFQHAVPASHFLVTNLLEWTSAHVHKIEQQGYTHVKFKVGRHPSEEAHHLLKLCASSFLKIRLDFNETLTLTSFQQFLRRIEELQFQVDFIEDPFPFEAQEWAKIQEEGWTLACDRQAAVASQYPEAARVLIVKPALHTKEEWQSWTCQTRIVTSYLGHPLEQAAAAYVASQLDGEHSCVHGLQSHHAYQPHTFSHCLNWHGPKFSVPSGCGFGFDHELQQLEWIELQ